MSDNPAIVKVYQSGKMKGVKAGKTTVRAYTAGGSMSAMEVTVENSYAPKTPSLSGKSAGYNSVKLSWTKESGATGRQKINKINRYLGMFLAFVQAYVFSLTLLKGDAMTTIKSTVYLTAGTAFLIWLGDEMTKKGIGNGMSLIIMAGIVNNLPSTFITAFQNLIINGSYNMTSGIILFVLFIIVYLAIILGVVYMQIAERRIPIQYSNRTSGAYAGEKSYIPIKLNTASVVPVIFASAIIGIPSVIANILNKEAFTNFVNNYIVYTSYTGFILYMLLIFVFGYFYTLLELNPDEMA